MKIGIIGLGLMGGSLGLALKKTKLVSKVVGFDHNIAHCEEALALNLVDDIVSFDEIQDVDMLFLAVPVEAIISILNKLDKIREDTTVVDLGSTKAKIIENTPDRIRENFVAAHPMTGTEKYGPSAAFEGLYQNQIVVLCEVNNSGDLHKDRAVEIFSHIGMKIFFMNAKDHDRHAAFISHLPHALSYALANTVMKQEDPKSILILAAGGFRDMSRIAKSSPAMWSDIFKQNKDNLLESIDIFQKELLRQKELIEAEKWDELAEWMSSATKLHNIL
jgi:prephenate dehydrogenase